MVMDSYAQLTERIAQLAKLPVDEISRKVEAKRAKLSGLVSKEGAAQIVAAELGINFEQERMRIAELMQGMKRMHIIGKVAEVGLVRNFKKQDREGKVVSMTVADESASIRVVLWDNNHISLIEKGEIKAGDVLEISNGSLRNGELHLSGFSDIKHSNEQLDKVATQPSISEKQFKDAQTGQRFKARAFMVQLFEPRYFSICPECRKKVVEGACAVHGSVQGEKRALVSATLDDGSENIRAVLFSEQLKLLNLTDEELFSLENFQAKKEQLLGEEWIFTGNLRANQLYNTQEFMVEGIEPVQLEMIIEKLKEKI